MILARYMNPEFRQIWRNFRAYHQFSRGLDYLNIHETLVGLKFTGYMKTVLACLCAEQ